MNDKPKDLKRVGTCKRCKRAVYHSDSQSTHETSNVGDYDFVCYPCQFELMDSGKWEQFRNKHLHEG